MEFFTIKKGFVYFLSVAIITVSMSFPTFAENTAQTETIIFFRHGEKPTVENGQLSCQGLNRALKLPKVLLSKFGTPQFLFAPNPSVPAIKSNEYFFYLRPLSTLVPLATQLNLQVNTTYAYDQTESMAKELLAKKYKNSLVFVAWEHHKLTQIISKIYEFNNVFNEKIKKWDKEDFSTLLIIKIITNVDGKRVLTLSYDTEGLKNIPESCAN